FNEGVKTISSGISSNAKLMERVYIPRSVTSINPYFINSMLGTVKVYGYQGTAAETFANSNAKFEFVPLAAPDVSGVEEGESYDIFEGEVSASWNHGHVAYLNGEQYYSGRPIIKPGEYTLNVINGYDEFTTEVHFTVTDSTPAKGDIDGDGLVTVSDALHALRAAAKLIESDKKSFYAGDIDGDGEITVIDALVILRASIGLIKL
ncbi:MAG: dockerin type I repeat-containing protein, partial [Clostridia bacterium]|nr:dockerin type I repeat-containing protein [Clostridia bacterium]